MSGECCLPLLFPAGLGLRSCRVWRVCWRWLALLHAQDCLCICSSRYRERVVPQSEKLATDFFKKKYNSKAIKARGWRGAKEGTEASGYVATPSAAHRFPVPAGKLHQLPELARELVAAALPFCCLFCSFSPFFHLQGLGAIIIF